MIPLVGCSFVLYYLVILQSGVNHDHEGLFFRPFDNDRHDLTGLSSLGSQVYWKDLILFKVAVLQSNGHKF